MVRRGAVGSFADLDGHPATSKVVFESEGGLLFCLDCFELVMSKSH
jgi:hypothetical protein